MSKIIKHDAVQLEYPYIVLLKVVEHMQIRIVFSDIYLLKNHQKYLFISKKRIVIIRNYFIGVMGI